MSQKEESLQWMVDVGVPKADVMWLASMRVAPHREHPEASRRIKRIHDMAYDGLVATVTLRAPGAAL